MSQNSNKLIWFSVAMLLVGVLAANAYDYDDDPKVIEVADGELRDAMSPEVNGLFNAWWDDNDISLMQWGGEAKVWLFPSLPVRVQVLDGEIEQDSDTVTTNFDRTAYSLIVDSWRLAPTFALSGRATYEEFDDGDLMGGHLAAHIYRESGSEYVLYGTTESFWSRSDIRNPRQYPRISDLTELDQNFRVTTVGGQVDLIPAVEQQLRLGASWADYEDENERLSLYAHWQLPVLDSSSEKWMVLRPNIYYETYSEEMPGYYSPDYHVSLGLGLHTVRKYASAQKLEVEIKPEWIFRNPDGEDEDEVAIHVILDYSVEIKKLLLGAGGFLYAEGDGYWLGVVSAKVGFRF